MKLVFDPQNRHEVEAAHAMITALMKPLAPTSRGYDSFWNKITPKTRGMINNWALHDQLRGPRSMSTIATALGLPMRSVHSLVGVLGRWDHKTLIKTEHSPKLYELEPDLIAWIAKNATAATDSGQTTPPS